MLTLNIDSDQGTGGVERGEIYDIYFPSEFLRLLDGPSCDTMDVTDMNVCATDDLRSAWVSGGTAPTWGPRSAVPSRACSSGATPSTAAA